MNATIVNYVAQDSLTNPDYTWSWSNLSCLQGVITGHFICTYVLFLSGLGCMLTRLVPGRPEWRLHNWCGWLYIISMIWSQGTAMIIHNTGLPPAVLFSFLWSLSGLTIGWFLIKLHQYKMQNATLKMATEKVMAGAHATKDFSFSSLLREESVIITQQKTFCQRVFSYKVFHTCFMITSWINIAGRVFSTNPGHSFTCYTIPAYKPISTIHGDFRSTSDCLRPVPPNDPDHMRLPWGRMGLTLFSIVLSVVPMIVIFVIYAIYIKISLKCRKEESSLPKISQTTTTGIALA